MDTLTVENLTFRYPRREENALQNVSFSLPPGQFTCLAGPSGGGKTTLLRHLKTVLAPYGTRTGEILFEGTPLHAVNRRRQSEKIGFVGQCPENQIVTDKVWHELAFGLESLGCAPPAIRGRVAETAAFFGIEPWFYKDVTDLSGGQKQLLNLASVMAMQPSLLILDEPTGQLDPIAASHFLAAVGKINRELGVTVFMTEHRLEEVFPLSDRVLVMDGGRIAADGTPRGVGMQLRDCGHAMFFAMPAATRIWAAVPNSAPCPVTVRDGRDWLSNHAAERPLISRTYPTPPTPTGEDAVTLQGVWFKYERNLPDVLRGLSLTVKKGEFIALLGGNGAGKTTVLSLISGLRRPYRGEVSVRGTLGFLPQNPQTLFVKKTVREDLYEALEDGSLSSVEKDDRVAYAARLCRLEPLLGRHPYDLSGGEQQRAALAKVLLCDPQILLLDEPTKGLDAEFKLALAAILKALRQQGVTAVMVSHDVEFCAEHAARCALLFDGSIVTEGTPRRFFSGNSFYTTSANRMARALLPEAITAADVIEACGGEIPAEPGHDTALLPPPIGTSAVQKPPMPSVPAAREKARLPKRTTAAAVIILLLIPLTLFFGVSYLDDRKYSFISLLVLLETMLPFALIFEGRRPQAREIVVIVVLCALGVAGRSAFFMLPEFKPVMALVIVSGVALGGEAGFLVGAMTMLVSNMMFFQGPWTPWQMFAMGITGFLAGVLFRKGWLRRTRVSLCVYGALSSVIIYGGIMNTAAPLLWANTISWKLLAACYVSGLPWDLVRAAGTVFFLWLAAGPMLEKLDRIKVKYGLVR